MALVLVACSGGPTNVEVVQSMAEKSLVPAMEESSAGAADLVTAVNAFCSAPSADTQATAQDAWRSASKLGSSRY